MTFRTHLRGIVLLASITSSHVWSIGWADSGHNLSATVPAEQGTVRVPSFDLPPSAYMSETAQRRLRAPQANSPQESAANDGDIAKRRRLLNETFFGPSLARTKALYPVDVKEERIAGVRTDVITPKAGVAAENRSRVLIELHPGGFAIGGGMGAIEAIPMASKLRIKVVSIDYRQAPEYKYPAATEDVTAVYKELLKEYQPQNIGIFGCSAGGLLVAESVAWFQRMQLPAPAAIGILCSSADARLTGDSHYTSGPLSGTTATDRLPGSAEFMLRNYFDGVDLRDPLVSPARSLEVLARFPPTLIVTGTRSEEMSSAAFTHAQLIKAGAIAELHLFDGMYHGYLLDPDLPETHDTYDLMARFFGRYLGGGRN